MEKNLYKQAIVDAKAVRASAIANAKATLQESIAPQIQEMMRLKLSEDLEEEFDLEEDFDGESGEITELENDVIDEASLEEILDELNALEEDDSAAELEEAADLEEEEDYLGEDDDETREGDEEAAEEVPVEFTAEKLESAIIDFVNKASDGKLTLKTDSIVAADEESGSDAGDMDDLEIEDQPEEGGEDDIDLEEEITLDEVLAELEKAELEEKKEKMPDHAKGGKEGVKKEAKEEDDKLEELEHELEEAQDAIITLNETLKELNLLNAKLLFANKILREKNLSESEKSRVIKAFDRTKTVKETKNTYSTLMESLSVKKTAPAQQLKESIGFASKPSGTAQKQSTQIVESDAFVSRWQKIAGIK
jgi:hypothetical protein